MADFGLKSLILLCIPKSSFISALLTNTYAIKP